MKKNKYIKEIASRLPTIVERTVSGYYEDYNQEGELVKFPNFVNHPINHERRIRNAYKTAGMQGLLAYISWINKIKANADLQGREDIQHEEGSNIPQESSTGTGPVPVVDNNQDTV